MPSPACCTGTRAHRTWKRAPSRLSRARDAERGLLSARARACGKERPEAREGPTQPNADRAERQLKPRWDTPFRVTACKRSAALASPASARATAGLTWQRPPRGLSGDRKSRGSRAEGATEATRPSASHPWPERACNAPRAAPVRRRHAEAGADHRPGRHRRTRSRRAAYGGRRATGQSHHLEQHLFSW